MICLIPLYCFGYIFFEISDCNKNISPITDAAKIHTYYFSVNGSDKNDGSVEHPFKTIAYLDKIRLVPGDSVFFKSGEIFNGNLVLTRSGSEERPVVITSYGDTNAVINGGNGTAIDLSNLSYVNIKNIIRKRINLLF